MKDKCENCQCILGECICEELNAFFDEVWHLMDNDSWNYQHKDKERDIWLS